MEVSEFEERVIERSKETPILVDFWAPWCGPCQFIGPILEELSGEARGRWELVKVNVDESQELATKYRVQGIPNMKLFVDGEVAAEQGGAVPKHEMEKWLEAQIPDPRSSNFEVLEASVRNQESGSMDQLRSFVHDNPDFDEAKMLLAEQVVFQKTEEAKDITEQIVHKEKLVDRLQALKDLSELMTAGFEEEGGASAKLMDAKDLLKDGKLEAALDEIIDAVTIDKSFSNDLPRRSAVAIFNMLGPAHEFTKSHRRRFDMALY